MVRQWRSHRAAAAWARNRESQRGRQAPDASCSERVPRSGFQTARPARREDHTAHTPVAAAPAAAAAEHAWAAAVAAATSRAARSRRPRWSSKAQRPPCFARAAPEAGGLGTAAEPARAAPPALAVVQPLLGRLKPPVAPGCRPEPARCSAAAPPSPGQAPRPDRRAAAAPRTPPEAASSATTGSESGPHRRRCCSASASAPFSWPCSASSTLTPFPRRPLDPWPGGERPT